MLAALGCDLLTGAGGGVMAAVSQAFFDAPGRRGIVIGIVPGLVPRLEDLEARAARGDVPVDYDVRPGYPNPWVEVAIYTHLPDSGPEGTLRSSRNHVNVLSSDAIVALPGGEGTYSEMWLARRYGVPLIAFGAHEHVPDGVAVTGDLDAVREFVIDALSGRVCGM